MLVVLTEWNEYRALDLREVRKATRGNVPVDLRNVYSIDQARDAGFTYRSFGHGAVQQRAPREEGLKAASA